MDLSLNVGTELTIDIDWITGYVFKEDGIGDSLFLVTSRKDRKATGMYIV